MFNFLPWMGGYPPGHPDGDLRRRTIRETSAFLSWVFARPERQRSLPRIPVRRVDEGGYDALLARPGARAAVGRWWERTLSADGTFTPPPVDARHQDPRDAIHPDPDDPPPTNAPSDPA